jgi:hypothetical protein
LVSGAAADLADERTGASLWQNEGFSPRDAARITIGRTGAIGALSCNRRRLTGLHSATTSTGELIISEYRRQDSNLHAPRHATPIQRAIITP